MNEIDKLLSIDPTKESEKIIGKPYTDFDDEDNLNLLGLTSILQSKLEKTLKLENDTYHNIHWDDFIHLLEVNNFKKGLEYSFVNKQQETNTAVIYYKDGLIIFAESWGKYINSGNLYGELVLKDLESFYNSSSSIRWSGEIKNSVLVFNLSVIEGLFNNLNKLSLHGTFSSVWSHHTFIWMVDQSEINIPNFDSNQIAKRKIDQLPEDCKCIIGSCILNEKNN